MSIFYENDFSYLEEAPQINLSQESISAEVVEIQQFSPGNEHIVITIHNYSDYQINRGWGFELDVFDGEYWRLAPAHGAYGMSWDLGIDANRISPGTSLDLGYHQISDFFPLDPGLYRVRLSFSYRRKSPEFGRIYSSFAGFRRWYHETTKLNIVHNIPYAAMQPPNVFWEDAFETISFELVALFIWENISSSDAEDRNTF